MAEEKDMILDEPESNTNEYYLLAIIDNQMDTLYALEPVNYTEVYDEGEDDKIKCVAGCFQVIATAQKALLKQIKNSL